MFEIIQLYANKTGMLDSNIWNHLSVCKQLINTK